MKNNQPLWSRIKRWIMPETGDELERAAKINLILAFVMLALAFILMLT